MAEREVKGTAGLTSTQRSIITVIVLFLVGLPAFLLTLPEDQRPPSWVNAVMLFASFGAGIVREQLGIKEAAVAVKAKAVDTHAPTSMKFGDLGKNDTAPRERAVV